MGNSKISVIEKILSANDQIAEENHRELQAHKVFSVNIMASPGAGKTSLIMQTINHLKNDFNLAVIEGDTALVTIDAEKVQSVGIQAVQINTGGECHLDASMIKLALGQFDLDQLDLIIVENVGNLICPAAFNLGTAFNVVISSIPEGDDKPYKYPNIYRGIQALIINKIDLKPYVHFDFAYFRQGIQVLNPGVTIFEVSCESKVGIQTWIDWLKNKISVFQNER